MAAKALKRTGLVAGVAAGTVGLAYATERALVARLRHRDDPDAGVELVPKFDDARMLDSHDGGTIYTISRGEGPVVVFCHGVTLSSRVWSSCRRSSAICDWFSGRSIRWRTSSVSASICFSSS